jgi:hypothetical protein
MPNVHNYVLNGCIRAGVKIWKRGFGYRTLTVQLRRRNQSTERSESMRSGSPKGWKQLKKASGQ